MDKKIDLNEIPDFNSELKKAFDNDLPALALVETKVGNLKAIIAAASPNVEDLTKLLSRAMSKDVVIARAIVEAAYLFLQYIMDSRDCSECPGRNDCDEILEQCRLYGYKDLMEKVSKTIKKNLN